MTIEEMGLNQKEISPIRREFEMAEPENVQLYAVNLSRPDGFVKILVTGSIATSKELSDNISLDFTRSHRGHYMANQARDDDWSLNDYISLNIGRAQLMFAKSNNPTSVENFDGGLGVVFPAENILQRNDTEVTYGGFTTKKNLQTLRSKGRLPQRYEKYEGIDNYYKLDTQPDKEALIDLVHIARMAGQLTGDDQAEVNIFPDGNKLPRVEISQGTILIPEHSKAAMERLIGMKIKEMQPFAAEIDTAFGVDITNLRAEDVIQKYDNIDWYSEKSIDEAVMRMSLK